MLAVDLDTLTKGVADIGRQIQGLGKTLDELRRRREDLALSVQDSVAEIDRLDQRIEELEAQERTIVEEAAQAGVVFRFPRNGW